MRWNPKNLKSSRKTKKHKKMQLKDGIRTHYVLIVVDTQAQLEGKQKIYMVTDQDTCGQATSELTVKASVGDKIVWRAAGVMEQGSPILEKFVCSEEAKSLFLNPPQRDWDGTWSAIVKKPGTVTYHFVYSINGHGEYQWDPFIVIN